MKYNFMTLLAAAFVLMFSPLRASAQLVVLGGNEITFGTIYQSGKIVNQLIAVKNIGNEKIAISHVSTSCGCTAAVLSDSSLNPGEQAEIKIEFNPTGYIGNVTKYVYISNSDPRNQLITVKITGNVACGLLPTPDVVAFYSMKPGLLDSSSIALSNISNETIQITMVEIPDSEITYRLDKSELKPGEFTDLHFYVRPKQEERINGFIQIFSTSALQPVLQVRVLSGGSSLR
jgi:hypothetical protein